MRLPPTILEVLRTLRRADSLRGSILLFGGSLGGSLLAYLVHFVVSRLLGPGEYGSFASLNSLLNTLLFPSSIVLTTVARYSAQMAAADSLGQLRTFVRDVVIRLGLFALAPSLALFVASPWVAGILQIPAWQPVAIVAATFFLAILTPVGLGVLQGLQRFALLGLNLVLGSASRLVFSVILVLMGYGAAGALGGSLLANLVGIAVLLVLARIVLPARSEPHQVSRRHMLGYSGDVALALLFFAVLANSDVVLVKLFFPAAEAGIYASASVLAKAVLFLPGAVTMVAFPKAVARRTAGRTGSGVARFGFGITALIVAAPAGALILFPGFALRIFFGDAYVEAAGFVGGLGAAMGIFALVQFVLYQQLARRRRPFIALLGIMAGGQVGGIALFHDSPTQVVWVLVGVGILILVLGEILAPTLRGVGDSPHDQREPPLPTREGGTQ